MTGAILGGSSVQQAAKLQMIIMFMITASTTLAAIFVTISALVISVDAEYRVRSERIVKNSTGVSLMWLWSRMGKGNADNGNGSESNSRQHRKRRWTDSIRSLTSLRGSHRADNGRHSEQIGGSDERARLLA